MNLVYLQRSEGTGTFLNIDNGVAYSLTGGDAIVYDPVAGTHGPGLKVTCSENSFAYSGLAARTLWLYLIHKTNDGFSDTDARNFYNLLADNFGVDRI
jgi:hypothetical protein